MFQIPQNQEMKKVIVGLKAKEKHYSFYSYPGRSVLNLRSHELLSAITRLTSVSGITLNPWVIGMNTLVTAGKPFSSSSINLSFPFTVLLLILKLPSSYENANS